MQALTQQKTNHLQAEGIFEMVRSEKDMLERECISLKSQRDWLEKTKSEIFDDNQQLHAEVVELRGTIQYLKRVIEEDQSQISDLNPQLLPLRHKCLIEAFPLSCLLWKLMN